MRVARGKAALDIAIGEGLEALAGRSMQLGYSCVGDYAREMLEIAASTAQKMARFRAPLREHPLLRAAVRAGEVKVRVAEAVLPKAIGDEETRWAALARTASVLSLKAAVKERRSPSEGRGAAGRRRGREVDPHPARKAAIERAAQARGDSIVR